MMSFVHDAPFTPAQIPQGYLFILQLGFDMKVFVVDRDKNLSY